MAGVGDNDTNSSTERAPSGDQHNPLTTQQASIVADEVWRNSGINALNPPQPQDVAERVHVSVPGKPSRGAVMHGDRETLFSQSQPQECNDQILFDMGSQPSSAAREGVRPDKQDTGGVEDAGAPPYSAHQRCTSTTVGTPEVLHAAETGGDSGVMPFEEFRSSVRPPDTGVESLPLFMRFRNPKLKGRQQKAHGSTNTPFSPVKPYGEPVITNRHHSPRLMRKFELSLRCWVLCPLVVILLVVAAVTMSLSFATSKSSSESVFLSLHDVVLDNIEESVGYLTLTKMVRMAVSTGSMYFSKNTFPNPRADILMPLEGGMMSRLCAVLRDMDPAKMVSSLGAVSLTRQQAAVCFNSRSRPGNFVGTVSRNGVIKGFYYVDPVTLEYKTPLEPLGEIDHPMSIDGFTKSQRFEKVVEIWKAAVEKGEPMLSEQYWVTPRHPPNYVVFVYPFFEVYEDGSTGVGYMYSTMFTDDIASIQWYSPAESGIRVMLVDPDLRAEQLLVVANSWGQPLANVTNAWLATVRGDAVKFMYVEDVEDPIMREALKHVDLRAAISSGSDQNASFPYGGFDGRITAKRIDVQGGVKFLLVVVTSRSYYLGPVILYRNVAIVAGIVVLLLVTVACVAFVECCLVIPLRATRAELKLALGGAPVSARSRRRAVLREVRELEDVCTTLRCRLDKVRLYMPERFNARVAAAGYGSPLRIECGIDTASLDGSNSEELKRVTCSVAYVYYSPRTVRNPTDAVVELMMRAVVKIATDCGGRFEVQRPDYCVISFGVQLRGKEFAAEALEAVEFARRLREELTACAELDGLYRVIVESGVFLSGVISGGGRSHFVLLCRNLHYRLGGFLPHTGVVAAVTEETALLVRGRCRLLPFETVYLEDAATTCVKLHEVICGAAGTVAWQNYEHCYSEAYEMMERSEYGSALRWWEKARAVEQGSLAEESPLCRSSQAARLEKECVMRMSRGDTAPFARRPRSANGENDGVPHSDVASTVTGKETVSQKTASAMSSFRFGPLVTAPESDAVSLEVAAGCLPHRFRDRLGNVWKRALNPIEDPSTEIAPVYMAISATGTLAVLKVCQLTDAAAHLSRAEVDAALEELMGLRVNDSLVQYLSYCYVPPHRVVLVMQYVPGGTLREMKSRYGRKLPLTAVRRNVASMLRGLAHLHGRGVIHGRLCPENVMVGVEGRWRLKGMLLGAAPLIMHQETYYVSLEVAAGGAKTAANDVYALGLLLLAMLTDSHPWQWSANAALDRSRKELDSLLADSTAFREALRNGLLTPVPTPADTDETLRTVLEACLRAAPGDRPTAADILVLCNPWNVGFCTSEVDTKVQE
ncbi:putative protein kinase [Trypanosoma cruzi]|nr:putative protein kinase [Trypanosoma cruzi]